MVKLNFNAVAFEQKFHLEYLARYMKTMELQFENLFSEAKNKAHDELIQSGLSEHSEDYNSEMSVIEHKFVDKYPQIFREQMLASIWGFIESSVFDTSEFFRRKFEHELSLKDIRARTPQQQWKKYFSHILKLNLHIEDNLSQQLNRMQKVRNILVHTGGLKYQIKEAKRADLLKLVPFEEGLIISGKNIEIEPIYLKNQMAAAQSVNSILADMMKHPEQFQL